MRRLTIVVLPMLCAACIFGDPSIDGPWVGLSSTGLVYSITLQEEDKTVTGSGSIAGEGSSGSSAGFLRSMTIVGTHSHPAVSLTFDFSGLPPETFTGNFETDRLITGRLSGADLDTQISFRRSDPGARFDATPRRPVSW